ncbi:hypothetical protein ACSFE6_22645 [Pseudomonas baetica]|uniref:hypothetical protein n=1 Tax=Pseudomonas baetica TaxID=674054 RepID=UPI003EEE6944
MPLANTTKDLLSRHYGGLYGPDDESYEVAVALAGLLKLNGVTKPGVIAVCYSRAKYWYVAVSPDLQKNIKTIAGGFGVTKWLHKVTQFAVKQAGYSFESGIYACTTTLKEMSKYPNPGCAEKKIVSALHTFGDDVLQLSLYGFPNSDDEAVLRSYVAVGDQYGSYLTPCSSCLNVANIY